MMKQLALYCILAMIILTACTKEEQTIIRTSNADEVTADLKASLDGKSIAVIYTYLDGEPWKEYFDPEHSFSGNMLIINGITHLNLEYLLSYEIYLFIADPPIYQVHLYFAT